MDVHQYISIMTDRQIKGALVSVCNALIEMYCDKYPEEYTFDDVSLGITEDGRIIDGLGDDGLDTIAWILKDIIPDLV